MGLNKDLPQCYNYLIVIP